MEMMLGNLIKLLKNKKIMFVGLGVISTLWFLLRVIPKPSRAGYPCMRAASPLMSGFIIYIISLTAGFTLIKNSSKLFTKNKYWMALASVITGFAIITAFQIYNSKSVSATALTAMDELPDGVNNPMGEAKGVIPGRVVWAWDPRATNENQTASLTWCPNIVDENNSDCFFMEKNNDQSVIDSMFDASIKSMVGKKDGKEAWDAIFKSFNKEKGNGEISYSEGEIIFIKINAGSIWGSGDKKCGSTKFNSELRRYPIDQHCMETTPFTVLATIRQLVDVAGVKQADIYIGDPKTNVYQDMYEYWKAFYPDINILGNDIYFNGINLEQIGRIPVVAGSEDRVFYSDNYVLNKSAKTTDKLYTIFEDASYLINIASLKAHARAGVTLCAKNHFGSHTRSSAGHLHPGLIAIENDAVERGEYKMYRSQVDLMGSFLLGRNTLICIVDGLYAGIEGYSNDIPLKWRMAPFNGDYPSSVFMSMDQVAIESVCLDFLRAEHDGQNGSTLRPHFPAVDDYLHQAADKSWWPAGVSYDPDNNGEPIPSLGVHEHWNNNTDKLYSKNLNPESAKGIELVALTAPWDQAIGLQKSKAISFQWDVYPNPASDYLNIQFKSDESSNAKISITDLKGHVVYQTVQKIQPNETYSLTINSTKFTSGNYLLTMTDGLHTISEKVIIK